MWIFFVIIGVLAVWAVVATVVSVLRDGYRAVPACVSEGKRKPS